MITEYLFQEEDTQNDQVGYFFKEDKLINNHSRIQSLPVKYNTALHSFLRNARLYKQFLPDASSKSFNSKHFRNLYL